MRRRFVLAAACLIVCATVITPLAARVLLSQTGEEITLQAAKFLATLKPEETKAAVLDYDSPARVDWHFIPKKERKGLQVRNMSEEQRKAAHTLLRSCLSQAGYDRAKKIMELENLLKELETRKKTGTNIRDPERYYFTVFGEPSGKNRWGLSIEGHHLTLNFVIEKGKVISSTPTVFCTNPAVVMTDIMPSIPKGTRIIAEEETLAFDLLATLSDDQRKTVIVDDQPLKEVRAAGEPQPPQDEAVGIAAAKLLEPQVKLLRKLIEAYCRNLPDELAAERLAEIEGAGFDKVHFAWFGARKPGTGHYYRIQGPTFLVEFVNTQPDADGNPANHIHCIWRDIRGDFAIPVKK